MDSKENLLKELKTVKKWEDDQKDLFFWEKIGRVPFVLLDKITPKIVHKKIGQLLDEIGNYLDNGGQYLVNRERSISKISVILKKDLLTLDEIKRLSIHEMDQAAEEFIVKRAANAKYQGATTGIGGIFTLAVDIPFLLGISLKTLQEIAISYGFDPNDPAERVFIIKCIQFASSDIVGKGTIIKETSEFENEKQGISELQGWREVMVRFRDNFGWKKLFQMVPIAGIIFGAWMNKQYIKEIGETGKMFYKKKRILMKLKDNQLTEKSY